MWRVEYTKRFLKELASLPNPVQQRVERIVFQALKSTHPFEWGYLEKMMGYPNKYKIRVGPYRIGITVNKQAHTILCQRIAHRKDIYKVFP
ncbi:plasmid stabilization system [Nitrosococcus watsonii C-113]|uniref:Plasmid stabilization system n=2 Tax=Nitrosococcus TaxID=1227 RepID=D8KBL6_NITWC|nr:plasmid stabilization system [Nitrosococcus watsonii C-113]